MSPQNAKSYTLAVRIPLHHQNALERVAIGQNTTISKVVRKILDDYQNKI